MLVLSFENVINLLFRNVSEISILLAWQRFFFKEQPCLDD